MSWDDTDHGASIGGLVSIATQTAVVVSAGLHIWAYQDGFEIAYRPLRPVKERLDDVISMLDRLDDDDKRRIRECCEAAHKSLGSLRTRHKTLTEEFERLKCERCERNVVGLHLGNMMSYVFRGEDEVSQIRRLVERLHKDTMRTTTTYPRSKNPLQRNTELAADDGNELVEVRIAGSEAEDFQSQSAAAEDLEEDITSAPVRAFFVFDDAEDSCTDKLSPQASEETLY